LIYYKSKDDIRCMRESGKIVADILASLSKRVQPGMTTMDLENMANEFLSKYKGAKPAFKGYNGFPASLCVSINHEVVHGIPSKKRIINDGDIVSIDFGVEFNGHFADSAVSVIAGTALKEDQRLLDVTKEALYVGIREAKLGNKLYDISAAIQNFVEKNGFSVVREFVGHGIGRSMHESPQVPNYGERGTGMELKDGLTIAIEPMVNAGTYDVLVLNDGWTTVTKDGKHSAHFEHSVAITEDGTYILTEL
jgi:methionyl aminopeptidase